VTSMMQTLIVALIVLAAAAYVGRKVWRALRPAKAAGCDTVCGCGADAERDDWAKT
jgi:hypothetical protein